MLIGMTFIARKYTFCSNIKWIQPTDIWLYHSNSSC